MAKLEMIAGQMYGFDYMDELHKLTDEITNETTKKITETTIDQRFIERYFEAQYKEAIIEFKSAPSKEYQQCARLRMSLIEQAALEKYSLEFSNKLHELAAKELDNQGRIKVYTYRRQHNDYIFIPPDRGIGEAKEYIEEDDRLEFISNVAEASNTQKPIKDKDLIANRTEQRRLKKQLAASGVYCQIKRGEKVNKKLYPAAWQNTTNEELGQFILSFTYQRPGTARGSKASICENKERYTLLFGKTYNSQFLCDLLKIKAYYKLWTSHIKKTDDGADPYKVGLVNNGMFFMTSIIGVICKMYYHPEIIPAINDTIVSEQKMEILSQHDMTHGLFKEFDEPKKRFFELFEYCYSRFYGPGYEMMKQFKERTANNYSNFTKINNNYSTYIIKQIMFEFRNGIAQDSKKFLENYLYEASEGELSADRLLLDKYANVLSAEISEESNVPEKTVAAIKDALIDYRTKVCKKEKRKPFEVFRNVSCDRIARFAPISEEELKNLRCLDEIQLVNYGSQIISIIKEVTSEA